MKNNRNMWLFNISLPGRGRYDFKADHFVVKNWKQNTLAAFLSVERAAFYKVFHVISGKGVLVAGLHHYVLAPGDVAFVQPDEIIAWTTLSGNMEGHFCFVHPKFFKHASHVLEMFLTFPHAHPADAVVPLDKLQSEKVRQSFELMHQEAAGPFDDKKQAILLHLQMILLKVRRAGKTGILLHERFRS
jgi:AraC family transcriptional regulator, transcriptional activator of pobA